jgi:hypothetical protein
MIDMFAIVPVPEGTPVPAEAILIGPLSECLACISVAQLNEQLLAASHRQHEREQAFTDQSTKFINRLTDTANRLLTAAEIQEDSSKRARDHAAKRAEEEQQHRDEEEVREFMDGLPDPDNQDLYSFDRKEREALDAETQDPNEMGAVYDPQPEPEPGTRLYPPAPQVAQPTSISLNEA